MILSTKHVLAAAFRAMNDVQSKTFFAKTRRLIPVYSTNLCTTRYRPWSRLCLRFGRTLVRKAIPETI